jgi:succinate dehydrogenase hydrophobic anchor subunit
VLNAYTEIYLLILVGFTIHWLPFHVKTWYREKFIRSPLWAKILLAVITTFIVYQAKSAGVQPFIYFQF